MQEETSSLQRNSLLTQLFFARDQTCQYTKTGGTPSSVIRKTTFAAATENHYKTTGGVSSDNRHYLPMTVTTSAVADTSRLKARRNKKQKSESVTCYDCGAEYHIACLV